MIKKIAGIMIFLAFAVVISWYFIDEKDEDHSKQSDPSTHDTSSKHDAGDDTQTLINEIYSLSEKGKVLHTSIIAGKTTKLQINDQWGQPEDEETDGRGHYETYPEFDFSVGYQDNLVLDVTSYHSELNEISMTDIKEVMGEPDEIRYYKDDDNSQIILIYTVNSEYQLKWVLSNTENNPEVDHVSVYAYLHGQDPTGKMVSELIEKMTLEEKIGQMIVAGISGTELEANASSLIHEFNVGGFILFSDNLQTPDQSVQLINQLKSENKQNDLPLLLSVDQEGGIVTRLPGGLRNIPENKEIGNMNNPEFSYAIGELLGKELQAFGLNVNYAPVIDVNSNPDNPVIGVRSFGDDPEIVSELGIQMMQGMQSQNIIPVIKHFPGHGDTSVDSHEELPQVNKSLEELSDVELIPFKEAIENGADVVMMAHILLPNFDAAFPSSMSKAIITDLLREQMGFDGVVITDDMTMKAITNNYDIGEAGVESVKAGSDIIMVAHDYKNVVSVINEIKEAVDEGEITEERINESVSRIIRLKNKYELNHDEIQDVNINELNELIKEVYDTYID